MPNPKPQPITSSPPDKRDWRPWLFNLALLGGAACLVLLAGWWAEAPFINGLFQTPPNIGSSNPAENPLPKKFNVANDIITNPQNIIKCAEPMTS